MLNGNRNRQGGLGAMLGTMAGKMNKDRTTSDVMSQGTSRPAQGGPTLASTNQRMTGRMGDVNGGRGGRAYGGYSGDQQRGTRDTSEQASQRRSPFAQDGRGPFDMDPGMRATLARMASALSGAYGSPLAGFAAQQADVYQGHADSIEDGERKTTMIAQLEMAGYNPEMLQHLPLPQIQQILGQAARGSNG